MGRSPLPFFKNWKKVPSFWEKLPWLCPSWAKFLILNVILRVSSRKKKHIFSLRGFSFMCCRWNIYWRALIPRKLPCPEKFLVTRLWLTISRLWQMSKWKTLWLKVPADWYVDPVPSWTTEVLFWSLDIQPPRYFWCICLNKYLCLWLYSQLAVA